MMMMMMMMMIMMIMIMMILMMIMMMMMTGFTREDREEKLRFAFRIYDIDNNGFISDTELFQVLKTMVGDNLKGLCRSQTQSQRTKYKVNTKHYTPGPI